MANCFHKQSSCYSCKDKRKVCSKQQKFGKYITNEQFTKKVICRYIPAVEKLNQKEIISQHITLLDETHVKVDVTYFDKSNGSKIFELPNK